MKFRITHAFGALCVQYRTGMGYTPFRAIAIRTLLRHPYDGYLWLRHGVMPVWVTEELPDEANH